MIRSSTSPLSAGDGGEIFREAFEAAILPRVAAFAPDLIIISAGFDAHYRDPLGNLQLTEADFAWATRAVMNVRIEVSAAIASFLCSREVTISSGFRDRRPRMCRR